VSVAQVQAKHFCLFCWYRLMPRRAYRFCNSLAQPGNSSGSAKTKTVLTQRMGLCSIRTLRLRWTTEPHARTISLRFWTGTNFLTFASSGKCGFGRHGVFDAWIQSSSPLTRSPRNAMHSAAFPPCSVLAGCHRVRVWMRPSSVQPMAGFIYNASSAVLVVVRVKHTCVSLRVLC